MKSSLTRWFVRQFSPKWTVGALGIVREESGKVLLLEHRFRAKPWGLPGGLVGWPESPLGGLVREVREEVGLELQESDFGLVQLLTSPKLPLLEAVFEHRPRLEAARAQALRLQASEVRAARWCDLQDVETLDGLLERHRAVVRSVLAAPR